MKHLSEEFLDRYLDHDLAPEERALADGHLAGCAACRAELAALEGLYGALDALPAEPLPIDLTPRVLDRITARPLRRRVWLVEALLVAQLVLTLALAAWLVPPLGRRLPGVSWPALDFAALSPARLVVPLADLLPSGGFAVPVAPVPLALAAVAILALWLAGNRLALAEVALPGRRRERGA